MIIRQLANKVLEMAQKFPIVSLTGPRQSGKTTLLKYLLPDYQYVSLENPITRRFAVDDPIGFLNTYSSKVIFDEIQRVPELFSYLQTKVDESRQMGQFIISGSQNFVLMQHISQSLAGRVAILRLLPLSLVEQKTNEISLQTPAEWILKGGYPALYDRNLSPDDLFPSYIETYVQRDVRELLNIRDLSSFQTFLGLCAGRIGQLLNLSSLAAETGISVPTAKAWLSLLESSYIIYLLQPHHENFNKRLVKSPKLYFYDTGLACNLLRINTEQQVFTYYQRGSLFENAIITNLIKNRLNNGKRPHFYFWQDSNKNEVDLLETTGNEVHLFEMKYTQSPLSEHLKNMSLYREFSKKTGNNYLIYAGNQIENRTNGTVIGWNDAAEL